MPSLQAREGLPNKIRSKCRSGAVLEVGAHKPEARTTNGSDPDQDSRTAHLMMRGGGTFQDQIRILPALSIARCGRREQISYRAGLTSQPATDQDGVPTSPCHWAVAAYGPICCSPSTILRLSGVWSLYPASGAMSESSLSVTARSHGTTHALYLVDEMVICGDGNEQSNVSIIRLPSSLHDDTISAIAPTHITFRPSLVFVKVQNLFVRNCVY